MSILDNEYIQPMRPYSQKELADNRNRLYKSLRLGKVFSTHSDCGHTYLVKENGRKERSLLNNSESNNCSVCWKLYRTPETLKHKATGLIDAYTNDHKKKLLSYDLIDLETCYYTWLYNEFN
jgi:hypothetical protein